MKWRLSTFKTDNHFAGDIDTAVINAVGVCQPWLHCNRVNVRFFAMQQLIHESLLVRQAIH